MDPSFIIIWGFGMLIGIVHRHIESLGIQLVDVTINILVIGVRAHCFFTEWVTYVGLREVVIRHNRSSGSKLLFTLFQLWEPLQESGYSIKKKILSKTWNLFLDLLGVLVNFPITLLKLILPLSLEITVILNSLWIFMVTISCVSGCTTLVFNNWSAFKVLIIFLHVTVPLRIYIKTQFH